jgi:hypothetical protein
MKGHAVRSPPVTVAPTARSGKMVNSMELIEGREKRGGWTTTKRRSRFQFLFILSGPSDGCLDNISDLQLPITEYSARVPVGITTGTVINSECLCFGTKKHILPHSLGVALFFYLYLFAPRLLLLTCKRVSGPYFPLHGLNGACFRHPFLLFVFIPR